MNGSGSGCSGTGGVDGTTRVVYFDGQRLEADDLNGTADQMRQLRWLHNRSLHGPGVALGFGATGNAGDRQVTVPPGYAIDCLGRELVLTTPITLPVPAVSGDAQGNPVSYALVAAYPADSQLTVIQSRASDCGGTSGAVRLQEQALIYWRQPPIASQEILLAMATIQNCQLNQPLAVDQTRRARPITTPYVASGQSDLGSTPWQPWPPVASQGEAGLLGVQATIDTSGGSFSATPTYVADLRGSRFFESVQGNTNPPFIVDGSLIVCDPTPVQFTAYILLPRIFRGLDGLLNPDTLFQNVTGGQDALISLVTQYWTIAWIGVED